jgi:hypothetical protein
MIRLTNILLEQRQLPNVLFVSDNGNDSSKGYARKLIYNKIVTGEVDTANDQPSEELVALTYYNVASGYYDVLVVQCSGLFDKTAKTVIDNLTTISEICKRKKIDLIIVTLPTNRFAKSDKYTPIDIETINNWIQDNADYVDLSNINDDVYFDKSGVRLNKQGQNLIYNKLKNKFLSYETQEEIPADDIEIQPRNLRKLQTKLVKLGYNIDSNELNNIEMGETTKQAIEQFQLKNSLVSSGELNKRTLAKLFSINAIPAIAAAAEIIPIKIQKRIGKIGQSAEAMEVLEFLIDKGLSVAGAAGIAGNMQVESQFKTDALGDKGTSIGLVQWHASRKDALFSWCESKSLDPLAVESQLKFLWFELETKFKSLTSYLKTAEDPRDAAYQFADIFENPTSISSKRMDYAEQFFNEYNSGSHVGNIGGVVDTAKSLWNTAKTAAISGIVLGAAAYAADESETGRAYFGTGDGKLPGTNSGGDGGDWAGSLPKLISLLPAGNWIGGHKRARKTTKSGGISDHYSGNTDSYAVDFMLDTAFDGDKTAATNFAIAIAQNAGKDIDSWKPYINSYLNVHTPDGYRVQIIWLSMVGGNHYDHVHVGVKKINKK